MWHYCNSCGEWAWLDIYTAMCAGCSEVWQPSRSRATAEQLISDTMEGYRP